MDPRYSVGIDLGTTNSAMAEVDLAVEPVINDFGGRSNVELEVKDLKVVG